MTDVYISSFVNRLIAGRIDPKEFTSLSVEDLRSINHRLEKLEQAYLQKCVDAIILFRTRKTEEGVSKRRSSESDILSEFGFN